MTSHRAFSVTGATLERSFIPYDLSFLILMFLGTSDGSGRRNFLIFDEQQSFVGGLPLARFGADDRLLRVCELIRLEKWHELSMILAPSQERFRAGRIHATVGLEVRSGTM
jgi:hypothetical protein